MNEREKLISKIKVYGRKNRLFLCLFALYCILAVGALIFIANNHGFYDSDIVKIISVTETEDHVEYSVEGKSETFYLQKIEARILNGERKGDTIALENLRSESNVYDTRFCKGDQLFVSETDGAWEITGVKRDVWVAGALMLFFAVLLIVGRARGALSFISLAVNVVLMWTALKFYLNGADLLYISIGCSVIFTFVSLLLICGISRMMVISLISTLAGTFVTFGIASAVMYGFDFNGLYVEGLEFLVIATDYRRTFMSQILIGGLGAIMDIAVSISSAMYELKRRDHGITRRALLRSAREVGRDITGTMTNVLLFTYLCGSLPLLTVIVSNGVPIMKYIFANCNLEIARFLVGSIGIVLCVPISCFVSAMLLTRGNGGGDAK